jgi:hypothetical protein
MQTHIDSTCDVLSSYENLSEFCGHSCWTAGFFHFSKGHVADRCDMSCLYGLLGGHMAGGNESMWQMCKATQPCSKSRG